MARVETGKVVNPKLFDPVGESALRAEKDLKIFSDGLKEVIKLQAKIGKQLKKSAKGFTQLAAAERKSKKASSEKEKVDKRILTLQEKMTKVSKIQRDREAALRVELQRRNKVSKQQAILANQNIGAFDKLNVKIKQLSDRYRNLLVAEGKETKATRILKKEILSLNKIRDQANQKIGITTGSMNRMNKTVGALKTGFAQLGLAIGVFQIFRNILGTIVNVDTALTDLAAISGKTSAELEPLKNQAFELGETTQNTASEILALQLELAKLGFTTDEIMKSTGGIQKFALATGAEIPEAAALAGSALRAFGLDASEMDRVVSVLAVATTKTALNFNFLQTAMSTIAPVAAAFGFSIEDTTALLGQLANAGFDASSAATATRNILLNLADANGELAKALGRPITSVDELAGAFSELQDKGVDLATALELTDKRSVAAFETFLKGSDSLVELRDSITDVTGELDEMSAKKLDSISGATSLLASAWEGLILEWNEGAGIGETLKNGLVFLAKNLKIIIKVAIGAVKVWVLYRIQMKLFRFETDKAGRSIAVGLIPNLIKSTKAVFASAKAFRIGAISVKSFGNALKRIPFLAIISGLFTLVSLFWDTDEAIEETAADAGDLEDQMSSLERVNKNVTEGLVEEEAKLRLVFDQLKATTAGTKERKEALDKVNDIYGLTLQNLSDEGEFVRQLNAAYDVLIANIERRIRIELVGQEVNELTKQKIILENELLKTEGSRTKSKEKNLARQIELQNELRELEKQGLILTGDPILDEQENRKTIARIELIKSELLDINDILNVGGTLQEARISNIDETIKRLFASIGGIQEFSFIEKTPSGVVGAEAEKLNRLAALRKKHNTELLELENELIKAGVDKELRDFIISQKRIEFFREAGELIIDLDFKDKGVLIKHENDYLKFIEKNQIERVDVHKKADDKIVDNSKLMFQELEEDEPTFLEKLGEAFDELRSEIAETAKFIAKFFENNIKLLDKQIEAEQRNFNEAKDREEEFKQLAKEKGLDATESIQAERDAQKKALEEQRKIEAKKAQIEALLVALRLLAAKVEQGEGNPVTNIKADILNLKSFVEGAFYDGTPFTIADALGHTSGRDSHVVAVDNDESIMTGSQTKQMGIGKGKKSTQDVVNELSMYRSGILANKARHQLDSNRIMQPAVKESDNSILSGKLDQIIDNTNPNNQPVDKTTFDVATGMLEHEHRSRMKRSTIKYYVRK